MPRGTIPDRNHRISRNAFDADDVGRDVTNTLNPIFTLPGLVNDSVLDMIGNTPMVDVSNLSPNPNVRILAKMEMQNPFGSVKDRIAKSMIETAEKEGRLLPGQTILEPSSGNTGIALAAIAGIKGYPIKILMPTSVSIGRRQRPCGAIDGSRHA